MNIPDFTSITLAKALGNPNHDPQSGRFSGSPLVLPPSDDIQTRAEAKEYYKANILGIWTLVINRKSGSFKVKVDMRENEEHAYTKTVNGKRVFWPERAKKMSAIIHTMTHPGIVLENGDRDLFVERASAGGHEVVVLAWKEATQDYRFRSFHYWTPEEFKKLTAPTEKGGYQRAKPHGARVQKDETPIRKSVGVTLGEHSSFESPPNFPNLHRTSLADSFELGEAHAGIGWPHEGNIVYISELVKSATSSDIEIIEIGEFLKAELTDSTPTPAQAEARNYAKRKMAWHGLTISIENEPGSVRKGNGWQTKMLYAYGYINSTLASDGDQIDVYIGPDESADTVYVVHQRKYGDWKRYDEDKCLIQFSSEAAARAAYLKHYDDPRFLGPITAMPVDEFVEKAKAAKGKMIKALLLKGGKGSGWFSPEHGGNHTGVGEKIERVIGASGQHGLVVENIARVSSEESNELKAEIGIDGSGYFHTVDNYAVSHSLKRHGSSAEYSHGQLPIGVEDIRAIPSAIIHPDAVIYGGRIQVRSATANGGLV